jgi:hypothetical protein
MCRPQAVPRRDGLKIDCEKLKEWRAQGDELFLAEFMSILPQSKIFARIEALIYRGL